MADLKVLIELLGKDSASGPIGNVSKGLEGLESKAGGAGTALAGIAAGATVAGLAAVAAGIGASVVAATDFESKMSAVKAVMSPAEIERFGGALQQLALQLGAETSFSASQAAEGLEELVKAGIRAEDIMGGGARAALDLAAAGAVKVKDAAEIASNAMNVFNLKGSDMGRVADVIAGAANASAIDVMEFKFALSQSGAVAAAAGVNFEELSTAIALMGNAGIKGSDAGTSLKVMLTNLVPSSGPAEKAFRQLGIITDELGNRFFDAEGRAKPLRERLEILKESVQGLSEKDRTELFHKAFGTDAMRAANVLANAGAEGFDTLAAAMAGITASDTARERLNNLKGALEQLRGSLETAAITVGLEFTPVLKELVDSITPLVNEAMPGLQGAASAVAGAFRVAIPVVREFFTFLGAHKDIIVGVVAALATFAVLTTVASGFTALVAAIGAASAAFTAIAASGGAIAAVVAIMGGPLTLVLAAIAAAVGVLAAAWVGNWGDIQGKTSAVVQFVKDGLEAWEAVFAGTARLAERLQADVGRAFDDMGTNTRRTQDGIGTTLREGWERAQENVGRSLDAIHDKVIEVWTRAIPEDIRRDLETIRTTLEERWRGFQVFIGDRLDDIRTAVQERWQAIATYLADRHNDIRTDLDTRWSGFLALISEKATAIRSAVQGKWDEITNATENAWRAVHDTIADWLSGPAGALQAVTRWSGDVVTQIRTLGQDALTGAGTIGGNVVSGIQTGISNAWSAFTSFLGDRVRDFLGTVKRLLGIASPSTEMADIGSDLIAGLQQGMGNAVGGFFTWLRTNVVERIPETVRTLLGIRSPSTVFAEIGGQIIAGLIKGLQDRLPNLQGVLSGIGSAITGAGSAAQNQVDSWIRDGMQAAGAPASWFSALQRLAMLESTNNPRAVNSQSVGGEHATGLMQVLPSTFRQFRPGGDIFNPVDSVAAAVGRIRAAWGAPFNIPGLTDSRRFEGYASGGWLTEGPYVGLSLRTGRGITLGEAGDELVLNQRQVDALRGRGGATYNVSVAGVGLDEVTNEIMRRLRREERLRGMAY